MTNLAARLEAGERILIDGGTGTEAERLGAKTLRGSWSATMALETPDVLRTVHEQYIAAGAEVIFANTYACSRHVLAQVGQEEHFERLNRVGIQLALEARENANAPGVIVSGSMSTTEQGGEVPPHSVSFPNYVEQAQIQVDAGAEMIGLEMMRDVGTTKTILEATAAVEVPLWLGMSCVMVDGTPKLYFGDDSLADAVRLLDGFDIELLAIMHTEAADVDACLDVLDDLWDGAVGVYAQVGGWNGKNWSFEPTITPEAHAELTQGWIERGVQAVGGCCGIRPPHIEALKPLTGSATNN